MKKTKEGLLFALSAYLLWGVISLFWKQLSGVNAYNALSYRVLWTVVTMLLYMLISGRTRLYSRYLREMMADKRLFWTMVMAGFLIALNWLTYIYAVGHGQATEASLGYYVMPLVSVVLALIFLKESLSRWMVYAVCLAGAGVCILVANTEKIPQITILLAFSFAFYGLLKKNVRLPSDLAMLVEAAVIAPLAIVYLVFFSKESLSDYSLRENLLLAASGIVTSLPLLLFAEGVKRAPLNLIGFIQYINPTMQLLIAVLVFNETIGRGELLGFALIWLAVFLFVIGQLIVFKTKKA